MTQDGFGKQPPANETSQRYKICIAYSSVEGRTKAERERNSRKDHRLRPFPYPLPRESPLAGTTLRGERRASRTVQISDKNPTTPEAKVGLQKRRGNKITSGSPAQKKKAAARMRSMQGTESVVVASRTLRIGNDPRLSRLSFI